MDEFGNNKEVEGFSLAELGQAIKKVAISRGKACDLKTNTGYCHSTVTGVFNGSESAGATKKILQTLGLSACDVMAEAKNTPDITRQTIDEAITILAWVEGFRGKDSFDREFKKKYPTHFTENGRWKRTAEFESDFLRAQLLGCNSIGDMINKAQATKASFFSVPDDILVTAVENLQRARFLTAKHFLNGSSLSPHQYSEYLNQKHFPDHIRPKLPGMFGLNSDSEIVDAANKLEPLPNRKLFGEAAHAHYHQRHKMDNAYTLEYCANLIGARSEDVFSRILHGCDSPAPSEAFLRRVPALFGHSSMRETIETAKELPKGRFRTPQRTSSSNIVENSQPEPGNFWTSLTNSPQLAARFGNKGPCI